MSVRHPKDPRNSDKHHERGPKRFWYTLRDLERLYGLSTSAVRRLRASGQFDPTDLESIVRLYNKRKEDAYRLGLRWPNRP